MKDKFLERFIRFCKYLISNDFKTHHKYQNKNQITNADLILRLLKSKKFYPVNIVDVGCGYGEWTKKMSKYFPKSEFYLFDANINNEIHLQNLKRITNNLYYKICLLSDTVDKYKFYNMGSGSSIFEENTSHQRTIDTIKSSTLYSELPKNILNTQNNLIKLDVQGAELKILNGLNDMLNSFEIVILEVSLHEYNKGAPLYLEVANFLDNNGFRLYDMFDLKRLGKKKSFLLQFDCVFVKKSSHLFNVDFN